MAKCEILENGAFWCDNCYGGRSKAPKFRISRGPKTGAGSGLPTQDPEAPFNLWGPDQLNPCLCNNI